MMMRHLAPRGARMAAFLIDCFLLALLPAALFYPGYYLFVPPEPVPPLLPLELLAPEKRQSLIAEQLAWESGQRQVLVICACAFALGFLLYYTISLLASRRGQTLGMATTSTRVVPPKAYRFPFFRALLRALVATLGAAVFMGSLGFLGKGISLFLPPTGLPEFLEGLKWIAIGGGGLVWLLLFLIPRRGIPDYLAGTYLVTLSGDIIEESPR